jgi:hypothetical protein
MVPQNSMQFNAIIFPNKNSRIRLLCVSVIMLNVFCCIISMSENNQVYLLHVNMFGCNSV